jgi:hypothetical protein
LLVVDRRPALRGRAAHGSKARSLIKVDVRDWRSFFDDYLSRAAEDPGVGRSDDAIVPSPLMPQLMADGWSNAHAADGRTEG